MDRATRQERLTRLARATEAAETAWKDQMLARDAEIAAAEADGWGVREIARATGRAPQTIERVLARETAQAQSQRTNENP